MNDYGFDYNVKGIRAHRRGGSLDMVCSHGLAFCNFDASYLQYPVVWSVGDFMIPFLGQKIICAEPDGMPRDNPRFHSYRDYSHLDSIESFSLPKMIMKPVALLIVWLT